MEKLLSPNTSEVRELKSLGSTRKNLLSLRNLGSTRFQSISQVVSVTRKPRIPRKYAFSVNQSSSLSHILSHPFALCQSVSQIVSVTHPNTP